ncbi:hypothetical protein PV409_36740 [Streptomyces sp. ME02-6979.5a]|uniref:hypothetical protein n=1 Tax=Streptomyces sp. ME02-6979.5a TaxID=462925 RepID=UPI0029B8BD6B|nr:hypothetical protein [Streptomyces sp. ME02-6979.5a]MDX3343511.1 hypothetical protein [Streptomyces sp. ME02-6979.5a]
MDTAVREWLLSQLGRSADLADLTARYTRLGTGRAVAIEVVRERLADLLASPGSVSVSGVVSINTSANIAAYERQLAALESGQPPAPDDPAPDDEDTSGFGLIQLVERPRR